MKTSYFSVSKQSFCTFEMHNVTRPGLCPNDIIMDSHHCQWWISHRNIVKFRLTSWGLNDCCSEKLVTQEQMWMRQESYVNLNPSIQNVSSQVLQLLRRREIISTFHAIPALTSSYVNRSMRWLRLICISITADPWRSFGGGSRVATIQRSICVLA